MGINCIYLQTKNVNFVRPKNIFLVTIVVLGTDNFNYLRPFYFIYLRLNVPEPGGGYSSFQQWSHSQKSGFQKRRKTVRFYWSGRN